MQKLSLTGMLPEEISSLLPKNKEKYRGMQIFRWIHERGAESFAEMTNLPASFRQEIENTFSIMGPLVASKEIPMLSSWQYRRGVARLSIYLVVSHKIICVPVHNKNGTPIRRPSWPAESIYFQP